MANRRLRLSKFEFDVVQLAGTSNKAPYALCRLEPTGTHAESIEKDISVAVMDTDTLVCTKAHLENDHQALAKHVMDSEPLKMGVALIIAEFLQHMAVDPYCKQAALSQGQQILSTKLTRTDLPSKLHPLIVLSKS